MQNVNDETSKVARLKRITKVLVFSLMFIGIIGCSTKYHFDFEAFKPPIKKYVDPTKINFFMETSVSMKGYVNTSEPGNYPLKEVVPYLITDLDKEFDNGTNIYTVTDKPRKYNRSKEEFYNQLRRGSLLEGKSSKLQNVFGYIIDSLHQNDISILVTDCILDLGKDDVRTQGSLVTTKIYDHLGRKPGIAVAVFKYLSDFNGTYYYDRNNTGSNNRRARPYYQTILKNRPFYVWVMGGRDVVRSMLSRNLFEKYDKVYGYNIPMETVPYAILKAPKSGKIAIDQVRSTVIMQDVSVKRPVQLTIGVNLENQPPFFPANFMAVENYEISPTHLGESIRLGTLDKKDLKGKNGNGYTHFLQTTLTDLDPATTEIDIALKNTPASWFKETNLADDYGISEKELEHKTFAFNFITDAFDKTYRDQTALLKFKLVQKQR